MNNDEIVTLAISKALDKVELAYYEEMEAADGEDAQKKIGDKYEKFGFKIDEHGRLGAKIRSTITCESVDPTTASAVMPSGRTSDLPKVPASGRRKTIA